MLFKKKKIKETKTGIGDIVFGVIEIIIEILDAILDSDWSNKQISALQAEIVFLDTSVK